LYPELRGALFSAQFGGVSAELRLWSTLQLFSSDRHAFRLEMIALAFFFKAVVGVSQAALF
jgi:hypothetical protein